MLDRAQILRRLGVTGLDRDHYWVLAGAAMVLHGVKPETPDIDLGCDTALADALQAAGYETMIDPDGSRRIRYGADIELFENWRAGQVERIENIPVLSLAGIVELKRRLGREKDQRDIALIRDFLKNHVEICKSYEKR